MKAHRNVFERIVAVENLFAAWDAFRRGKGHKPDVLRFERNLEQNVFALRRQLRRRTYRHGPYAGFYICDPKQRHIHKAGVLDRLLHHAVFAVLSPIFEPTFIPTSFSCRVGLGTHKGVETVARMIRKVSRNGTRPCFVLKCDVRKFFESVDHGVLLDVLGRRIRDEDALWLLREIVESYSATRERERERERDEGRARRAFPLGI